MATTALADLIQVQDTDGTWHAAAVGPGVLCDANRRAAHAQNSGEQYDAVTTVQWDIGADLVDCPELACQLAAGRR